MRSFPLVPPPFQGGIPRPACRKDRRVPPRPAGTDLPARVAKVCILIHSGLIARHDLTQIQYAQRGRPPQASVAVTADAPAGTADAADEACRRGDGSRPDCPARPGRPPVPALPKRGPLPARPDATASGQASSVPKTPVPSPSKIWGFYQSQSIFSLILHGI